MPRIDDIDIRVRLGLLDYYSTQARAHIEWMIAFGLVILSVIGLYLTEGFYPTIFWSFQTLVSYFFSVVVSCSATAFLYCIGRTIVQSQFATRAMIIESFSKEATQELIDQRVKAGMCSIDKASRIKINQLLMLNTAISEDMRLAGGYESQLRGTFLSMRRPGIFYCLLGGAGASLVMFSPAWYVLGITALMIGLFVQIALVIFALWMRDRIWATGTPQESSA